MTDYPASPRSDADLDLEADKLRSALGIISTEYIPDIIDALASASKLSTAKLRNLKIVPLNNDAMNTIDQSAEAFCEFDPPSIHVREDILIAAKNRNGRARFTLAHELMHLWLDHRGVRKFRSELSAVKLDYISPSKSSERQANRAAGAFLMPAALVMECQNDAEVASRFSVSMKAAETRWKEVEHSRGKKPPTEVIDFLARKGTNGPLQTRNDAAHRVKKIENEMRMAWECLAVHPAYPKDEFRMAGLFLVRWTDRHKLNSHFGWLFKDGRILAYQDYISRGY